MHQQIDDNNQSILGIDPGLCITGWAVLRNAEIIAYGVIRPKVKEDLSVRLQHLYCEIKKLIKEYDTKCMAIEAGYCGIDGVTALKLGMVRGAIMVAGIGLDIQVYSPSSVKLHVTGHGHATKDNMMEAIQKHFPLVILNGVGKYDIADAIGVGLCAISKNAIIDGSADTC